MTRGKFSRFRSHVTNVIQFIEPEEDSQCSIGQIDDLTVAISFIASSNYVQIKGQPYFSIYVLANRSLCPTQLLIILQSTTIH